MTETNHFFMIAQGYELKEYTYIKWIGSLNAKFSRTLVNMSTRSALEKAVKSHEKELKEKQ